MKQPDLGLDLPRLIERQAWLHERGRALDERLGLSRILGAVGRAHLGGSYETGLMMWPDLDYTVTTPDLPEMRDVLATAGRLVEEAGVWRFNVADHRSRPMDGIPCGIYLGPEIVEDDDLHWQVDVWFTDEAEEARRRELADRILRDVADEHRDAILTIKQVAAASDRYHRGVSSVDIYFAVLDHGVRDPEGFDAYLEQSGRSL